MVLVKYWIFAIVDNHMYHNLLIKIKKIYTRHNKFLKSSLKYHVEFCIQITFKN